MKMIKGALFTALQEKALNHDIITLKGRCLLRQFNVASSRSAIRPAMFDLELEWTVRVRGAEKGVNFY